MNNLEVLKPPPANSAPNFQKYHDEMKSKSLQESQASTGCFATVMDTAHLNFIIPCIPMHLCAPVTVTNES